jgi:hypothetical protein
MKMAFHIGTISHGTLANGDLIISFADALRGIEFIDNTTRRYIAEADAIQVLYSAGWNDIYDHEMAEELLSELISLLNVYAPPYTYFGNTDGDGSDFGFWPSEDAISELPKFNDLSEVPEKMEDDYVVVNDHGNMTIYGADHKEIWSIV